MRISGLAQDRPGLVNAAVAAGVGLHWAVAQRFAVLDWPVKFSALDVGTAVSVHLAAAGLAAMVGGFAGVIVVFGLTSGGERFRVLRRRGGSRLRANWTSTVSTSLVAAFVSLGAAVAAALGAPAVAGWVLELSVLALAAAAARLVWLLRALASTIDAEDLIAETIPADQVVRPLRSASS